MTDNQFAGAVAFEGRATDDGRLLMRRSIRWNAPMLPLIDSDGAPVGVIAVILRDDGAIRVSGVTSLEPGLYPVGIEITVLSEPEYDGEPHEVAVARWRHVMLDRVMVYTDGSRMPAWPDAQIEVGSK